MNPRKVVLQRGLVPELLPANVASELLLHVMSISHVSLKVTLAPHALATHGARQLEEAIMNALPV